MLKRGGRFEVCLRILLVTLFVSYYGSTTLFTHTHHFEGGNVTHSHPYVPSGHHTHTAAAITIISGLTNLVFIAGIVSFALVCNVQNVTFEVYTLHRIVTAAQPHCPLRAPPVC